MGSTVEQFFRLNVCNNCTTFSAITESTTAHSHNLAIFPGPRGAAERRVVEGGWEHALRYQLNIHLLRLTKHKYSTSSLSFAAAVVVGQLFYHEYSAVFVRRKLPFWEPTGKNTLEMRIIKTLVNQHLHPLECIKFKSA